ncbi:coenzyme F420-reducing hydrogenase beta subunit [Mangrovibacterium diazotrophicum]|uniref:Coenzyme F420-reducing hydrogenase beta subunit n=2 Tax=Mangrovibacterium diazotrophicum TaxID=1261403 RepID=A0A419VX36_9BACT|nr:Coenzyme F420 hydrogenase/dehydrogenase, beta subunit C-terminal domain [Mangrovibacterium diazotrophicum]RKD87724.1 coenzyme F420-reducing hydrogenase beta subunit [Mangrovibacterium diazotrophicum]
MDWNSQGFLIPVQSGTCSQDNNCISVCPFNPFPEEKLKTETEISSLFLDTVSASNHKKLGNYFNTYAGYSIEHRMKSSSGGIATYVSKILLEKKIVKYIINVVESKEQNHHFSYTIGGSIEEVSKSAKTRYYPVTLENVFEKITSLDGDVAIVGIPCFIKAIRLAQIKNPDLRDKIKFTIGIICGGIKSKFFTEYLTQKAGVSSNKLSSIDYRIKDISSHAGDYSFGVKTTNSNDLHDIKMRTVGDMWGTGLFKANACDFCDDVSAELADISLGDAWIRPFVNDGQGTNVIITRTSLADQILQDGLKNDELHIEPIQKEEFIKSQKGSYTHRQDCLSYRIKLSDLKYLPPKRVKSKVLPPDVKIIQKLRRQTRLNSLTTWANTHDAEKFDAMMKPSLRKLRLITKFNHYKRGVVDKLKKL